MREVDPADIPETGERYDMTLDKVGAKNVNSDDPLEIIVRALIDNGDYCKKRVSTSIGPRDSRLSRFVDVIGATVNAHPEEDIRAFLRSFKDREKEARFSAMVFVEEYETNRSRNVRYDLAFFAEPEDDAELHLRKKPTQFER